MVITEDGYILQMHRIPHGKSSLADKEGTLPVAFLMHGITCSSADWLLAGSQKSLGKITHSRDSFRFRYLKQTQIFRVRVG